MTRLLCSLIAIIGLVDFVSAQDKRVIPDNIRAENTLDRLSDGGLSTNEILIGIPVPPGEVIGDYYLISEWRKTSFTLNVTEKLYEGFSCRYNIHFNQLEIKTETGINALSGSKIKSFVWIDQKTEAPTFYVNAQYYFVKGIKQAGFLNVISDGSVPLFKKTSIVVREPDYKHEFSMGSRDTQIKQKQTFFYTHNNELVEIKPKDVKKLEPIFGERATEIENFIRKNSLSFGNEFHLKMIFDFYNGKLNN
jgi:hypothetical protein